MYQVNKIAKEKQRAIRMWKIISVILYIVIIPIIIINFTLIIKSFINPNETPSILGYKNYIIVSGSMEPTIMTGDSIFVKEVPENEIKVNDIISFQDGETITTHRIIAITEENGIKKYTTKGDNNQVKDKNKVTYEEIEGKYQFKINGVGTMLHFLQNKIILILLILILIGCYWYSCRINNRKMERKEKRKKYKEEKMKKA